MSERSNSTDRLDSWKAISEYLGRDVRTLQRWETQGLPVRRVAGGGRGSSVFAYKSEIDAWMRAENEASTPATPRSLWRYVVVATLVASVAVLWALSYSWADRVVRVTETPEAVVGTAANGAEQWRFSFPTDEVTVLPDVPPVIMLGEPFAGALASTAVSARRSDGRASSGVVRWFGLGSRVPIRSFSFDDQLTFGGIAFSSPWTIEDVERLDAPGPLRIAVAARHNNHWPSLVTILDDQFQRHGTFVNSGWVLAVRWLDADRLLVSGFNQANDGGMLAVLDAHHVDGTSPEHPGSPYRCDGCAAVRPLFYAVFPRSELNRWTASRFNGAGVDVLPSGTIVVHTKEVERESEHGPVAEAVYEFSTGLELTSAIYGTDYWDRHRALELEGKITHSRDKCPERDGPPFVLVSANGAPFTRLTVHR